MININNDLETKIALSMIKEVFKSAWKASGDFLHWVEGKTKEYDFTNASKRYGKSILSRYGWTKTLGGVGMTSPISLDDIFTSVNILYKITAQLRFNFEEIEEYYDKNKRGFGKVRQEKVDGLEAVKKNKYLMVLGKPGAGKTTFLKHIAIKAIQGPLGEEKRLPVFINIKDFSESENESILDFIIQEFDICHFPEAKPFVIRLLKQGKLLLLFDGLDEITKDNAENVQRQIRNFYDKYENNQFIISCRVAAYNYYFKLFTDVEVADFDDGQIKSFIKKWFRNEPIKANKCIKKLFLPENAPIKDLGSIPLLLTLLCLAFEEEADFPSNRAELYMDAIDALLRKWDSDRNIERDEIYHHLSTKRKKDMFAEISEYSFKKNQYLFRQAFLSQKIANFLKNLPEANTETIEPDSEKVLKSIEAQHGIFVERASRIYSFSHMTFQEFFTAQYIVDQARNGTLKELIKHLTDKRWREVFLLVAGMLTPADDLILLMKKKTDKIIKGGDTRNLLNWANYKATSVNTLYKPVAIRGFYIYIALVLVRSLAKDFFGHNTPSHAITSEYSYSLAIAKDISTYLDNKIPFVSLCSSDLNNPLDLSLDLSLALALVNAFALAHASHREFKDHHALLYAIALDIFSATSIERVLHDTYNNAIANANGLGFRELANKLEVLKRKKPDRRTNSKDCFKFANELHQVMFTNLGGLGNYFDLSYKQLGDFTSYLYANKLILDCLDADCYVNRKLRANILDNLLIIEG